MVLEAKKCIKLRAILAEEASASEESEVSSAGIPAEVWMCSQCLNKTISIIIFKFCFFHAIN